MSWSEFVAGVLGGVVATILWFTIVYPAWLMLVRWWRYHRLEGRFQARLRSTADVHWHLKIERKRNRLVVNGVDPKDGERTWASDIVMNDDVGRGTYFRNDDPDAFGFHELHLKGDSIYVIETWVEPDPAERRLVVSGYLWERID